ncbi:MAG: glycerol-3-phosphate acyltransferase [Clostridiales bacterium]|nr:glycerol-3-phosphate acyltransferase [Clostridiales bacterium]
MLGKIIFISILGFFSGSVLFAQIIPRAMYGVDIVASSGNGNPGTANVFSICGKKCGILTAILEFAKGFFPVLMGNIMIPLESRTFTFGFIILAPVMGHMFSVFHNLNGGMGIATTFGTLIAVYLQCKALLLLVMDYAIGKFLLKFRHSYQRTLFVFGAFLVELIIFGHRGLYTMSYICIACAIMLKCIYITETSVRQTER